MLIGACSGWPWQRDRDSPRHPSIRSYIGIPESGCKTFLLFGMGHTVRSCARVFQSTMALKRLWGWKTIEKIYEVCINCTKIMFELCEVVEIFVLSYYGKVKRALPVAKWVDRRLHGAVTLKMSTEPTSLTRSELHHWLSERDWVELAILDGCRVRLKILSVCGDLVMCSLI